MTSTSGVRARGSGVTAGSRAAGLGTGSGTALGSTDGWSVRSEGPAAVLPASGGRDRTT